MRLVPVWLDDCPRPADLWVTESPPGRVDVAVIGGGYTGLAAADALAAAGASVAVFERHALGAGASARNAGMVLAGVQADVRSIFATYGEEVGRSCWQASLDAVALVARLHAEEGVMLDRSGALVLAARPEDAEALQREAEWFERVLQHRLRFVPRADLATEVGTDVFYGGLVDPVGFAIHPVRFLYALARRALRRGAIVLERAPVTGLRREGGWVVVRTPAAACRARHVIVATSGGADELVGDLAQSLSVGSAIVATAPLPPDLVVRLSPTRRLMYDTRHLLHYFRVLPDGRLLWGGRASLNPRAPLAPTVARLRRALEAVFPALRSVPLTHAWSGRIELTRDLMPRLIERDGVQVVQGLGGHGIALGVWLGRVAAARVSGHAVACPFAALPCVSIPRWARTRWFLSALTGYYWLKDAWPARRPRGAAR